MAGPDYIVEVNGRVRVGPGAKVAGRRTGPRPWLAVRWRCCSTYSRIYRNPEGTAYDGHCPRCSKPIHVTISADGTNARFFEAF